MESTNYTEAFYKKLLDDLLEPLELKTHQGKVQSSFQDLHTIGVFLKDTIIGGLCSVAGASMLEKDAVFKYLVCGSYEQLAKSIQNTKWIYVPAPFLSNGFRRLFVNPYFGYSIEEMLIARDLLVDK